MTFPTRSQPPLFATIPPFEGLLIAQTSEIRSASPTPPTQYQGNDPLVLILGTLLGGGVLGTAFVGFWAKFGNNFLTTQQSKSDLQNQLARAKSDLDLKERQVELDAERLKSEAAIADTNQKTKIITDTLNLSLTNNFQNAKEYREIYYLLLQEIKEMNQMNKDLKVDVDHIKMSQKDIFNKLNMEKRENV
jgi:hypothetical protein